MRIAMVASEAAPFVKTGGLGDVMQALPNALSKLKGNEICLFLPYYKRIKENPAVETEQVGLSTTTTISARAAPSTAISMTASASPISQRP